MPQSNHLKKMDAHLAKYNMNIEFNKNDDSMRLLISQMEKRLEKIYLGGGKEKIDKQHKHDQATTKVGGACSGIVINTLTLPDLPVVLPLVHYLHLICPPIPLVVGRNFLWT